MAPAEFHLCPQKRRQMNKKKCFRIKYKNDLTHNYLLTFFLFNLQKLQKNNNSKQTYTLVMSVFVSLFAAEEL